MTWPELEAQGRVSPHNTSRGELDNLREAVALLHNLPAVILHFPWILREQFPIGLGSPASRSKVLCRQSRGDRPVYE